MQQGILRTDAIPTAPPPYPSPFISNVLVPGGVTTVLSTSDTLYVAGQQLQPDGLFAGFLSTINLAAALTSPATAVTGKYSISDGTHTKLLFADDNTLWIGSQSCATGERAKLKQNYNCLTRFDVGAKTAQIIPKVNPTDSKSRSPIPIPIRTSTTTAASPASAGSRASTRCTPPMAARFTHSTRQTAPRSTTSSSPSRAPLSTSPTWTPVTNVAN